MGTNSNSLFYIFTTARAFYRRTMRRDFHQMATSIFSFATKCKTKVSPCGIRNAFGEMVVFNHVSDLQVFDNNSIISRKEMMRGFVMKVFSLVGDVFVLFSKFYNQLLASMTAFFASGQVKSKNAIPPSTD